MVLTSNPLLPHRLLPGDEVCLTYGRHTNLELLELYGFVCDDNPHDKIPLPLDHLVSQGGMPPARVKLACSSFTQPVTVKALYIPAAPQIAGNRTCHGMHDACCLLHLQECVLAATPVLPPYCLPHIPLHQAQAQLQQHLVGPLVAQLLGSINTGRCSTSNSERRRLPDWLAQEESFLHANGQPSFTLLRALRTSATPPHERKAAAARLSAGEQVSEQSERVVRLWLVVAASVELSLLQAADSANNNNRLKCPGGGAASNSQMSECGKVAAAWVATQVSALSRVAACNWLECPLT
jgi:hypothetical protein